MERGQRRGSCTYTDQQTETFAGVCCRQTWLKYRGCGAGIEGAARDSGSRGAHGGCGAKSGSARVPTSAQVRMQTLVSSQHKDTCCPPRGPQQQEGVFHLPSGRWPVYGQVSSQGPLPGHFTAIPPPAWSSLLEVMSWPGSNHPERADSGQDPHSTSWGPLPGFTVRLWHLCGTEPQFYHLRNGRIKPDEARPWLPIHAWYLTVSQPGAPTPAHRGKDRGGNLYC